MSSVLSLANDPQRVSSALAVAGIELAASAIVCLAIYAIASVAVRAIPARLSRAAEWRRITRRKTRTALLKTFGVLGVALLGYNAWLLARGVDPWTRAADLAKSIPHQTWQGLANAFLTVAVAVAALLVAAVLVRRTLRGAERVAIRWHWLKDRDRSLPGLLVRLERAIVRTGWLLVAVLACRSFVVLRGIADAVLLIARVYALLAVGAVFIRAMPVIVDTLDALADRYARTRGWSRQYGHLRRLLPTLRACLEYASWVALVSLVLVQLAPTRDLAAWGPRLIEALGILLAGRAIVELGRLEIGHRMLPSHGLEETERRRRATMVPLVRSAFGYGAYFGTAVLILGALGFNPMPFLAGAGLLGLVIGFGAQSLINDVVSGFFILFENIYLVGDIVEVGAARGVVEAIEFRVTKIRDAEGRLHVVRNGDMKPVVNYSKDYTVAVVAVEVAYDADLPSIFASLRQAGERLRAESEDDLLGDTEIEGITAFGASTMTVRTLTRVKAGRHEAVAATLRYLIKEVFDQEAGDVRRQTLVASRFTA